MKPIYRERWSFLESSEQPSSYDLWGDAINTASRMQSHGVRGRIHLTENTYMRLKDRYQCEQRGVIDVKGKGEMRTYFLVDRKIPA